MAKPIVVSRDPDENWANNDIQFPRLLAEIMATQDHIDFQYLAQSMDLTEAQVQELFDRAQKVWDEIAARTGRHPNQTV